MYHVSCHHVLQVGNIRFLQPSLMFLRLNCARKSRCFPVTLWFVSTAIVQSWGGGGGGGSPLMNIANIPSPTPLTKLFRESIMLIVWGNPESVTCAPPQSSAINQNSSHLQRISLAQRPPVLIFSCKTNIYGEKFAFYSSIKQKHFIVRAFGNSLMIDVSVSVV